jgi:type II secretory pathway pseudopilin PulG
MAGLLVAMSVMAIALTALLPAWRTMAQREKEAELIFRGEQYARAINLFQRKFGNAAPPDIDTLVSQRFLRKKYKDPITGGDFQVITAGANQPGPGAAGTPPPGGRGGAGQPSQADAARAAQELERQFQGAAGAGRGGVVGVMSTSPLKSFRVYNGRDTYNQWVFMGVQQSTRGGGAGGPAGPPGRGGIGGPGNPSGRGGIGGTGSPDGRGGIGGRGGDGRGGQPVGGGRGTAPPPPQTNPARRF